MSLFFFGLFVVGVCVCVCVVGSMVSVGTPLHSIQCQSRNPTEDEHVLEQQRREAEEADDFGQTLQLHPRGEPRPRADVAAWGVGRVWVGSGQPIGYYYICSRKKDRPTHIDIDAQSKRTRRGG